MAGIKIHRDIHFRKDTEKKRYVESQSGRKRDQYFEMDISDTLVLILYSPAINNFG